MYHMKEEKKSPSTIMTNVSRNFERCRFRYPNVFDDDRKTENSRPEIWQGRAKWKQIREKKNCFVKHWNKSKFIVTHVFMPMIIIARNKSRKKSVRHQKESNECLWHHDNDRSHDSSLVTHSQPTQCLLSFSLWFGALPNEK